MIVSSSGCSHEESKKNKFTYFALAVSSPSLSWDAFNPRIYSLNAENNRVIASSLFLSV